MTTTTTTRTLEIAVDGAGRVPLTITERGEGRPVLLLHGSGGPLTVNAFADRLAAERPALVIRRSNLASMARLARRDSRPRAGWRRSTSRCWRSWTWPT